MADRNKTFVNISASSSLRIVILVSKRTYLEAGITMELIANTYLQEIGSHFLEFSSIFWHQNGQFINNVIFFRPGNPSRLSACIWLLDAYFACVIKKFKVISGHEIPFCKPSSSLLSSQQFEQYQKGMVKFVSR